MAMLPPHDQGRILGALLVLDVEHEQRRRCRRAQLAVAIVKGRFRECDATSDRDGSAGRTHLPAALAEAAQIRDLEFQRGISAVGAELRVDRDAAGAVEEYVSKACWSLS
nr:hypothetical protein [Paracoccus sp. MC1854]